MTLAWKANILNNKNHFYYYNYCLIMARQHVSSLVPEVFFRVLSRYRQHFHLWNVSCKRFL